MSEAYEPLVRDDKASEGPQPPAPPSPPKKKNKKEKGTGRGTTFFTHVRRLVECHASRFRIYL